MALVGIVCEFNPFHNGHKYLIDRVKSAGDTVVTAVSGNYVQRAEPAIFPKEERVRAALLGGADIALEIPFLYASATARLFCENAVKILYSFGCRKLTFGAENADLALLINAADLILSGKLEQDIEKLTSEGASYAAARSEAYKKAGGGDELSYPNNILAVEYICAVKALGLNMELLPIERAGAGHDTDAPCESTASATYIRKLILQNRDFTPFVPASSAEIYKTAVENGRVLSPAAFSDAICAVLRLNPELINSDTAYITQGFENRLRREVTEKNTLEEIFDGAKTKRFAHSRVRRALLCAAFGITKNDSQISVPYCRVLGFKENAASALGAAAKSSLLPVVTTYKELSKLQSEDAKRVFSLEEKSTDIYNFCLQKKSKCLTERTFSPIKL